MTDANKDDRLDKLEAMCTDLFRQLRNVRDDAAKDRLDNVGRLDRMSDRVVENKARISEVERNAENRMDLMALGFGERFQRIEARLGKLSEEFSLSMENGDQSYEELIGRIRKLESQTYEQQKVLNRFFPTREPIPEKGEATGFKSCMVLGKNETLINAEKRATFKTVLEHVDAIVGKPQQHRKSLGWFNCYGTSVSGPFMHRKEADLKSMASRLACIEIFEGDGL